MGCVTPRERMEPGLCWLTGLSSLHIRRYSQPERFRFTKLMITKLKVERACPAGLCGRGRSEMESHFRNPRSNPRRRDAAHHSCCPPWGGGSELPVFRHTASSE